MNKVAANRPISAVRRCYKLWYLPPRMQATPRSSFQPAGAGALLLAGVAVGAGVGALVGWAAGSIGLGLIGGVIIGIPAGVLAVYRRYRGAFS